MDVQLHPHPNLERIRDVAVFEDGDDVEPARVRSLFSNVRGGRGKRPVTIGVANVSRGRCVAIALFSGLSFPRRRPALAAAARHGTAARRSATA
jgi:hypothetical protein